jgi:hypothetical protein
VNDEQDDPDQLETGAPRGHVRIFVNAKGQEQWSVTARVGETLDDLEAARANAVRIAERLREGMAE